MMYKLYVVGSTSPDPADWSAWDEVSLVIATTEQEALELDGRTGYLVTEIPLTRSILLLQSPPVDWGKDA